MNKLYFSFYFFMVAQPSRYLWPKTKRSKFSDHTPTPIRVNRKDGASLSLSLWDNLQHGCSERSLRRTVGVTGTAQIQGEDEGWNTPAGREKTHRKISSICGAHRQHNYHLVSKSAEKLSAHLLKQWLCFTCDFYSLKCIYLPTETTPFRHRYSSSTGKFTVFFPPLLLTLKQYLAILQVNSFAPCWDYLLSCLYKQSDL